jgi:Radical SAM superfamily
MPPQTFHLVMIKPTHYDDEGYPIQWLRSLVPSNTLACIHGLAEDAQRRKVLGPDVEIRLDAYDETNKRVFPKRIIREIRKSGGAGLVMLVGVQSNQFPRAVDIARQFAEAGIAVCIGGFHVSGCLAMLPDMPDDLRQAQALGISLFAGEAEEGRLDAVMADAFAGKLAPLYNLMSDLPGLEGQPPPLLPARLLKRTVRELSSADLGRGCPYQCSFCTIINVQGRKSRVRTADDLERIMRENYAQGIKRFFITDDNFARNSNWESLFDRLILLRGEGLKLTFVIQVDTLCHKIPNFIEKAAKAGVTQVFIGMENINPDNLIGANKRQNKITEYRALLQKWRTHGVLTFAGYILGFPADTKQSIIRDIEIIKRELPVDILEFFVLTPLPGSEDHKTLLKKGVWMDPDMNKYDLNHRVCHHGTMSDVEWDDAYRAAWRTFYTPEHVRTVLRRNAANPKGRMKMVLHTLLWFTLAPRFAGVHPLELGVFRLKTRRDRRPGMARENPLVFYPRVYGRELLNWMQALPIFLRFDKMRRDVTKDPDRWTYSDIAIAPMCDDEEELDLYQATAGGSAALTRKHRDDAIRGRAAVADAASGP